MNNTGLWCNEQLGVVDVMTNLGLWMSWTIQEEGHYTPKGGDCGPWLQVKSLKDDQDEGDQLTKREDLNASREGDAPDETQRKWVALMKIKKWKDVTTKIEKITNSELKLQWTTLGCGYNEQHRAIMKWTTLRYGHCEPQKGRSWSAAPSQITNGWPRWGKYQLTNKKDRND